jgi:hypothetical protein
MLSFGESSVLVVFLLMLLLWLVLIGFLAVATIWFQGYIYTEPVTQIYWRAPAAGSALALFLVLWVTVDYRAVKNNTDAQFPYGPIQELAPALNKADSESFPALWAPNERGPVEVEYKSKQGAVLKSKVMEYKLNHVADARKGHVEYRHGEDPIPSSPPLLFVEENGEKILFQPDTDDKGHFKRESGQPLLYRDNKGRVLTEGPMFERKTGFPFGRFLLGVFLNALFPVIWFVCLWLLLRFQLLHAVGLAVVLAAVMLLFIVQPLMSRAEAVARPQPVATTSE